MSAVQALAAMLSADSDARSRLGAAQIAAGASNANANAALQGDMFRASTQGAIAHRGIDAQMQQAAGELALRRMLGGAQLGLDSNKLRMAGRQLGLDEQKFGLQRDATMADYGKGPLAPSSPFDEEFRASFDAASPQDALAMFAKRMILGNATNPRMMAGMGGLFEPLLRNQTAVDDRAWKERMAKDPTAIGMALAPVVGQMEGMTPQQFPAAMQQLLSSLGIPLQGSATVGADGQAAPSLPSVTAATQMLSTGGPTQQFLGALGLDLNAEPTKLGDAIGARVNTLTGEDMTTLQQALLAKLKMDPTFLDRYKGSHGGIMLLRKLLGSPAGALNPTDLKSYFDESSKAFSDRIERAIKAEPSVWGGMGSY